MSYYILAAFAATFIVWQAGKDYAFHSYQAKKYAGSKDGAWHADMAERARRKM